MKGTRLYSAPRSPLIQGRSSRENSFRRDWMIAGVLSCFAVSAVAGLFFASKGASLSVLAMQIALPGLVGVVPGAGLGVRLAVGFGWHPRWVSGAATGAVLGMTVIFATLGFALGTNGV